MTDTPAEVAEALDVLVERADVELAWKRPSSELADTIRAHIADLDRQLAEAQGRIATLRETADRATERADDLQSQLAAQRARDGRDADWKTKENETHIAVLYLAGDPPFIYAVRGMATEESISECNAALAADPDAYFGHGDGEYVFSVSYFSGQYDEYGRCEFPPGYEMHEQGYEAIKDTP